MPLFRGILRPSMAGELLAHELLGHGLAGQKIYTDGKDEAVQAGNLFLRTNRFKYFRKDHATTPNDPNTNPNGVPSYFKDNSFFL